MKRSLILLLLFLPFLGWTQTTLSNWNEVGVNVKANKHISLSLSGQSRWNVTDNTYSKSLFSARLKVNIVKPLAILVSYRRAWFQNDYYYLDNEFNTYGHRIAAGISWDIVKTIQSKSKTSLKYTTQFQKEVFKFKRDQIFWRNRMELNLHVGLKRLQPYFSAESFFRTNQQYQIVNGEVVTTGLMNEMRYGCGLNFNLPGNHEIQLGMLYRDFKTNKWDSWVIEFGYNYTIQKKKVKTVGTPEF